MELSSFMTGGVPAFWGLTVLGGVLALDETSLGQTLLSRPLVTSVLVGGLLGDPFRGLWVGAFLEVWILPMIPVGGARVPEGGVATLVAVVASMEAPGSGGLAVATLIGVLWAQFGAVTTTALRRINGTLVDRAESKPHGFLIRAHFTCLALDFLRGSLLTVVGFGFVAVGLPYLASSWPLELADTKGILGVFGSIFLGLLYRGWATGAENRGKKGRDKRRWVLLIGMVVGLTGAAIL